MLGTLNGSPSPLGVTPKLQVRINSEQNKLTPIKKMLNFKKEMDWQELSLDFQKKKPINSRVRNIRFLDYI